MTISNETALDQSTRYELTTLIWDMYKDAYSVRPRHMNMAAMSIAQLEAQVAQLNIAVSCAIQEEAEWAAAEKRLIVSVCAEQNISLATYNRWMVEA